MGQRIFRLVAGSVVFSGVLQALLPFLSHVAGLVITGSIIATAGFVASVGFVRRAVIARGRHRVGWWVAVASAFSLGVSYLLFGGYAIIGVEPGASPGGPFSMVAAVGSVVGVLLLAPRLLTGLARFALVMDVAIVAASLFVLSWQFIVAPASRSLIPSAQVLFVLTMLPDVAAAALALVLVSRSMPRQDGYALHLFAAGLGTFAVAAALTTANAADGQPWYAMGAGMTSVLASLLIVLASRATLPPADVRGWRTFSGVWATLPYVPVLAGIAAVALRYLRTGTLDPVLVWLLLGTSAAAMLRQFLSLITVRKLLTSLDVQRERLDHQAHHDSLTELPNRAAFHTKAGEVLASAAPDRQVAVLLLDLDGFKPVNDTFGHAAGDAVLVTVGRRFAGALRADDFAARLGGDEFGILLPQLTFPSQADDIASRLIDRIAEPMQIDGELLCMRASVGIAIASSAGQDIDSLLRAADHSLYQAKAAGKGRAHRHDTPTSSVR